MSIWELCSQQMTLFIMILTGTFLKKRGIIDDAGKRCLTDLCVNIVIPCNIIKSCIIAFDSSVLRSCGFVLLVGALTTAACILLNQVLFRGCSEQHRKVLRYCTLVSNGGFLGNPVAEGIYGGIGLLYASMFLIPMRIVCWSVGTSYFVSGEADKKKMLKNVVTHPCLVAVYFGIFLMVSQLHLPGMVESSIRYIGNCNSALTMFIIGTILADVDLRTMFGISGFRFSFLRLILLPAMAYAVCLPLMPFGMDRVAVGVSVMLMGMPAGSTAAIFAARYEGDAPFATAVVVLSTLLSMITIPLWVYLVG